MFGKLTSRIVAVSQLSDADRKAMFRLMTCYYEGVTWECFNEDLDHKLDVIMIHDKKSKELRGFSTLLPFEAQVQGRPIQAIFSGDTVVDKHSWGSRLLGRKFLYYLVMKKLQHPRTPLYWLLISKGYKTYLLMANNFKEHYPRYERPTPADKQMLMDTLARKTFKDRYSEKTGCCRHLEPVGKLRAGIAPITAELIQSNARIQFFIEKNPDWIDGVELVCIARMTWYMPLYYLIKSWWKKTISFMAKGEIRECPRNSPNMVRLARSSFDKHG